MAVDQFGNPLTEEELYQLMLQQQQMGLLPGLLGGPAVDTFSGIPSSLPAYGPAAGLGPSAYMGAPQGMPTYNQSPELAAPSIMVDAGMATVPFTGMESSFGDGTQVAQAGPSWGFNVSPDSVGVSWGVPKDLPTQDPTGGIVWPDKGPVDLPVSDIVKDIIPLPGIPEGMSQPEIDVETQIDTFSELGGIPAVDVDVQAGMLDVGPTSVAQLGGADYSQVLSDAGMAPVVMASQDSGMGGGGPGDIISENLGTGHPGAGVPIGDPHPDYGADVYDTEPTWDPSDYDYNMPTWDPPEYDYNMPTGPKKETIIDEIKDWWDAPLLDKFRNLLDPITFPIVPPVIASTDVPGRDIDVVTEVDTFKDIDKIAEDTAARNAAINAAKREDTRQANKRANQRKAMLAKQKLAAKNKLAAQKAAAAQAAAAVQAQAAAQAQAQSEANAAIARVAKANALMGSKAYQESGLDGLTAAQRDIVAAAQVDTFAGISGMGMGFMGSNIGQEDGGGYTGGDFSSGAGWE
jgi:hypothetical protein